MNPSNHQASHANLIIRAARALALAALFPLVLAQTVFAEPMDEWTKPAIAADVIKSPNTVFFANGKYWAGGASGKMQYSTNGIDWTVYTTPTTSTITSITYGNGRYVAVGYQQLIMSSADGISGWTVHEHDPALSVGSWSQVTFVNGQFIVVGRQGQVRKSANGTDWTSATMNGTNFYPSQLAWNNGLYVSVGGEDGARNVQTSPNAVNWTRQTTTLSGSLESVAFFNGLFVASGESYLATSPDGVTWTKLNGIVFPYSNVTLYGLKVLNGRLFAFGEYGVLLSSINGTDWVKHTTETTYSISCLDYNGERLLLIRQGIISSGEGPAYSDPWAPVGGPATPPTVPDAPTTPTEPTTPTTPTDPTIPTTPPTVPTTPGDVPTVPETPTTPGGDTGSSGGTGGSGGDSSNGGSGDSSGTGGESDGTGQGSPTTPNVPDQNGNPGGSTAQLVNLSTRAWVGTGDNLMISGFLVKGTSPKTVLVRAVGPTLGQFGITTALADPQLRVLNAQGVEIASNDNWSANTDPEAVAAAALSVGAFALPAGSKDAAMLVTVQPGVHTILISGVGNGTGIALAEVYDCASGQSCRLVNISSRTLVGTGDEVAITGFVVSGTGSRDVLIRGIGPTLAAMGITGATANPKIALYNSNKQLIAQNDDWGTAPDVASLTEIMAEVGAFALPAGSADAAMVVTVEPGLYSIVVSGAGATAGLSLLELYEIQ